MRFRAPLRRVPAATASLIVLAASTSFLALVGTRPAGATPSRPNIVVINTDDQRFDSLYACLAAPPDGRTGPTGGACPMPHIRSDLMAHGVTFAESFVTTALCCPSRASLFLGAYAHRTGVLTNEKPSGGFSAFRTLQDSTIGRWLHDSGYRTSLVGKYLNQYDVCAKAQTCAVPQGWDDWHAEITDGDVDYDDFQLADSLGNGQAAATSYPGYSTTVLGQKAVSFVTDSLTNHPSQPLFLYLAPFAPHPKAVPAPGDETAFDAMPDWRPPSWNSRPANGPSWTGPPNNNDLTPTQIGYKDREHRNEMAALLEVDRQVHAVVRALGPAVSNTLIAFTSDNGLSWGEHAYFDKKNCEFEECHRVPMVVRYDPLTDPGGTGPGRVDTAHAVLNIDLAPTAADAGRLTDAPAMDGRSLLRLLDAGTGNDPLDWRTAILGEDYGGLIPCSGCVRTPTLRSIRTLPGDPLGARKYAELCAVTDDTLPCPTSERELYNESGDPYETNNTAVTSAAPGSVQAQLAARLAPLASTQAPSVVFSGGPPPATPQTSATLAFSAAGASRYWCSVDGAPRLPCTSPVNLSGPLPEGAHTFAVVAEGENASAGIAGTSAPGVRTWTVDTTRPDTTITAGPSGPTAATVAQFSFTSNEAGGSFTCSVDDGGFSPCTPPTSLAGLSEAAHTFAVRAIDAAGNSDATPSSRTWSVDVTPPDTSIDSGPSGPVSDPGPFTFDLSASEGGASFQCRLSGAGYAPCDSPHDVAVPSDGNYSLTVKATDPAGNIDPSAAVRPWTVDTAPPPTPLLTQTPNDPSGPAVSFAWDDGDDSAAFACSIDAAPPTACSSPASYSGLGNGGHSFSVVATDPAGNSSGAAQFAWTVSTTGPAITITNGPADDSFTSNTSATFKFGSSMQGTAYECALDGGAFAACDPRGTGYTSLADRVHSFSVRGTAGGITGPTTQRAWTVDTQDPDTTIDQGPAGPTASTGPFRFRFSSNEADAAFKCKLDGAAFATCDSPYDVPGPLTGRHSLTVKAVDRAGNVDPTPEAQSWTVDTAPPPAPSITQKPPATNGSASASFSFTDSEAGVSFACSLDGAPPSACTSPGGYASLLEGLHTFGVTAIDLAGNTSGAATWQWTVDTTAPDTTITDGPPASTTSTGAQFTFTATEPWSTFQCSLDGAAFGGCSSPRSYTGLTVADHDFRVRATDAAGNTDPSPAVFPWTVTPAAPDTTILSGPDDGAALSGDSAMFTFSSTLPGSTFECALDGAGFAPCDSGGQGAALTGLGEGAHTFSVFAEIGGTPDPTPATRSFSVDTRPPSINFSAPTVDQLVTVSPFVVKWNSSDPPPSSGSRTYVLEERDGLDGSFSTVAGGAAKQATRPVGTTTCWRVTATDPAGNAGTSAERCAALPVDDPDLTAAGPATQVGDDGAYLGTITRLTGAGGELSLSFTGRKAAVLFQRAPDTGKARISVDGAVVKTVDTYAASLGQQRFLWAQVLASGPHTVVVAWSGTRNGHSTGTDVAVDGIAIVGTR